jgi:hypothetical protein
MRNKWVYRGLVIAVASAGYLLTVARTVSLWDCGEYIACIHTLGIAHPPGSPFYMILGKVWEQLLFFIPHVAFRINLLSAVCSVLSCLLMFEIAADFAGKLNLKPGLRLACGLMAGLLLAFSDTFWFNGVEAEVYAFSITAILLSIWIVIKWEEGGSGSYSRWILLLVYLAFLGIGVHMYSMLLVPFLLFFMGLRTRRILPGLNVYVTAGIVTVSFAACFMFPELAENRIFLGLASIAGLVFLILSIRAQEVRDISYWALAILLCSVITLTKPFLVSTALLLGALAFTGLFFNSKFYGNWLLAAAAAGLNYALFRFVPLTGQFDLTWKNSDTWLCLGLAAAVLAYSILASIKDRTEGQQKIRFYCLLLLLAAVGYSTHLYIPIRSHLNPAIDENNPENWSRLQAFIERKQYGSQSMLVRMFNRRGLWSSQFGDGHHMGFFRYQSSQFLPKPESHPSQGFMSLYNWHMFLAGAMLLLTLWIVAENFRRNAGWVGLMLSLYAVCSVGLILYMNFADGNRIEVNYLKHWKTSVKKVHLHLQEKGLAVPGIPDPNAVNDIKRSLASGKGDTAKIMNSRKAVHLKNWRQLQSLAVKQGLRLPNIPSPVHKEVRVRDYFFTPAFVMFVLLFSAAVFLTLDKACRRYPAMEARLIKGGLCLALVLWTVPFGFHLKTHNRAYDYIASDFAGNVLQTCPPNAILFTNGDNDTFPLWYKQQVEKVRTDVTIVNFSLANTDWYAKQFTYLEPRIRFPGLDGKESFPEPRYFRVPSRHRIPIGGDSSMVFDLGKPGSLRYLRGQDHVLMESVLYNYPRRPICFTLSTPQSASMGLEKYFQTVGMVYVLSPRPGLNLAALDRNLLENYKYRYVGDRRFVPNASAKRMVSNYRHLIRLGLRHHARNVSELTGKPELRSHLEREQMLLKRYRELESRLFTPDRESSQAVD